MTERETRPIDEVGRMVIERLSSKVAALLEKPDMTQEHLAAITGYSQPEISRFVRMETKRPELTFLHAMARLCGTSLVAMLQEIEPPPTLAPDVALVAAALESMERGHRQMAAQIVMDMAAGAAARRALQPSGTPLERAPTDERASSRRRQPASRTGEQRARKPPKRS